MASGPAESTFVHPTAVVEDGARLGAGTKVWHHAHVRAGASVGERCVIAKNVFVDAGVVVGNGVKLENNVSVFAGVELADEVFVGPGAVLTNDRVPRASGEWTIAPIRVGRGASVGANATLVAGIDVGEWAMIGAGAVVVRPVLAHELVVGNPAHRLAWVCACGAVRIEAGQSRTLACDRCGTALDLPA